MTIAKRLLEFLKQHDTRYKLVAHPHTGSSMETAEQAHVPGDALAKGVVVREDSEFLLVVLPADYHIELESLKAMLGRDVMLAVEGELGSLFPDCEMGAVPPVGEPYGLTTIWDPTTSLGQEDKVFFEAGDHEHLISVSGKTFHELMAHAERGEFSRHV
ncbi:MAG: YbaK/EbsC family protein [Candidatus Sedimenticola sp. 6PFRAG7]